jgi:hypothetical protein
MSAWDDLDLRQLELESTKTTDAMLALDGEIADIKSQLDKAKARHKLEGVWAEASWFARANSALRHKQRERQALQIDLGKINRLIHGKRGALGTDENRLFVYAAKRLLTEEQYMDIWAEVRK